MNTKRIVALFGPGSTGKTKTLKLLIDKLQALEGAVEIFRKSEGDDILAIFNYKDKLIGIATGGDLKGMIADNFSIFIQHDCDIVFSACRTRGETSRKVEDYANRLDTELIWAGNTYNAFYDPKNPDNTIHSYQADLLLKLIN